MGPEITLERGESGERVRGGDMIGGREPELDSEESCYGTPPMSRAEGSERRIMPGGRDYRVIDEVTGEDAGSGSSYLVSQTSGSEEGRELGIGELGTPSHEGEDEQQLVGLGGGCGGIVERGGRAVELIDS